MKILRTISPSNSDEILDQQNYQSFIWKSIFLSVQKKRYSDIHILQKESSIEVLGRIDGEYVLISKIEEDHSFRQSIIVRFKQICRLDISTQTATQDQSFQLNSIKCRFRVSVMPAAFGESIVLRVIRDNEIPTLDKIDFGEEFLNSLKSSLKEHQGLICVTGPTGSGKSTTLQAGVMELDRKSKHVITIENPIERIIPDITQVEISENVSWEMAIRASLRHDPDVILIGEVRDRESASLALEAAQTGHLVLTTLHTNSVSGVVDRLIGLGVDRQLIADNLLLVTAQRLVPLLCAYCKIKIGNYWYRNQSRECGGCDGVGIKGRIPIIEYIERPSKNLVVSYDNDEFEKHLAQSLSSEKRKLVENGLIEGSSK